jgi:predicted Zn-dependent peptidase
VESSAGADMGQVSIATTRERVSKAIELLSDIILNPAFPDTAFDSARTYFIGKASDEIDSPLSGTYSIFLRTFYRGSPFERPAFGRVRTISECRRGDMVALYRKLFVGGNITVCFVGNFDGKKVMAELEKAFTPATPGTAPSPALRDPVALPADTLVTEERQYLAQSLVFGYPAPGYDDPDYPAMLIVDSYLRSGDRSPIAFWLPERRLATGVGVLYPRYPKRSSIAVYLGATPTNWKAARDTVATVMQRLTKVPLDIGEWPVQIRRVQNGFFNEQSSPIVRARDLSRYETEDLGLDYPQRFEARLLALTPEDVRAAAARWFTNACEATILPSKAGSRP